MRLAHVLVLGIVLGVLVVFGGLQVGQVFGQNAARPMGSMMGQMMRPQRMAEMMESMMRDPQSSMTAVCARAMQDPAVSEHMTKAMDDPQMRKMMEQMYEMMPPR